MPLTAERGRRAASGGMAVASPTGTSIVEDRIISLDTLRGLTVLVWILSTAVAPALYQIPQSLLAKALAAHFSPSRWDGFTVCDLTLPIFLFVAGASIVPAFERRRAAGQSNRQLGVRLVRRVTVLFAIGVLCEGGLFQHWPALRFVGAFQRIAICYAIVACLHLTTDRRIQVAALAVLLLDYWAILEFGSTGAPGTAYSPEGNAAAHMDQLVLPGIKYFGTWDPQGILTTIPAVAVMLAGLLAAKSLRAAGGVAAHRSLWLLGMGIVAAAVGVLGEFLVPINPYLWTVTFCLVAIGAASALLGIIHGALHVHRLYIWAAPVIALGRNPLVIVLATVALIDGTQSVIELAARRTRLLPEDHSTAWRLIVLFVIAMITFVLDRRKLYIRA
jgi:predicted acyltransferase